MKSQVNMLLKTKYDAFIYNTNDGNDTDYNVISLDKTTLYLMSLPS